MITHVWCKNHVQMGRKQQRVPFITGTKHDLICHVRWPAPGRLGISHVTWTNLCDMLSVCLQDFGRNTL